MTAILLADLAAFLDRTLRADQFAGLDDPHGIWHGTEQPVAAVGLLLEPWPGLQAWVDAKKLGALIVHRPWDVPLHDLGDVGVLGYHLAFDEAMTLGFNPTLATTMGLDAPEVLGRKADRPIGMIGAIPNTAIDNYVTFLAGVFRGLDRADYGGRKTVGRVAVVGAMTDALVREAATRGADLYVTGQSRVPARAAVEESGIAVVAIGHRRSEEWGMRALAAALRGRWPTLRVLDAPGPAA